MASTIKLKNGSGAPLAGDLVQGEPALDLTNKRLYTENASGTVIEVGTNPGEDVTFADNRKAIFGAGSDLQIYHDASDSIILDNGTGNLKIQANDLVLKNADGSKEYLKGTNDGSVRIRHNNTTVLETTATGIDVTGTVTADGLTVDLTSGYARIQDLNSEVVSGTNMGGIEWRTADSNVSGANRITARIRAEGDGTFNATDKAPTKLIFSTHATSGVDPVDRMNIAGNGDISFFEDTGTTAKFFWDASAEFVGIGTDTQTANGESLRLINGLFINTTGTSSIPSIAIGDSNSGLFAPSAGSIAIATQGGQRLTVAPTGNVGIGTSSPSSKFDVVGGRSTFAANSENFSVYLRYNSSTSGFYIGSPSADAMAFSASSGAERMRIDASGSVGIGTSSPRAKAEVYDSSVSSAFNAADLSTWRVLQVRNNIEGGAGTAAGIALGGDGSSDTKTAGIVGISDNTTGGACQLAFLTATGNNSVERMRIDSSGNVGIGVTNVGAPLDIGSTNPKIRLTDTDGGYSELRGNSGVITITADAGNTVANSRITFETDGTERARIDSSGNLLVGTTDAAVGVGNTNTGHSLGAAGYAAHSRSGNASLFLNRTTNSGNIVEFAQDGTTVGNIGTINNALYMGTPSTNSGVTFQGTALHPTSGAFTRVDNTNDIGSATYRWDDIYATNGTIQTSDRNEKQDIEALSDAEQRVAVAAKGLLRKFRWKDSVEEKGGDARIHFGIIAQDLQAAFEAEGLDAGRYAMFINSTWTDEETGEERSRMGVRYSELLAFIIAAI